MYEFNMCPNHMLAVSNAHDWMYGNYYAPLDMLPWPNFALYVKYYYNLNKIITDDNNIQQNQEVTSIIDENNNTFSINYTNMTKLEKYVYNQTKGGYLYNAIIFDTQSAAPGKQRSYFNNVTEQLKLHFNGF